MDDKLEKEVTEFAGLTESPDILLEMFRVISKANYEEVEPQDYSPFIYPH
jgi:hypothetical protein